MPTDAENAVQEGNNFLKSMLENNERWASDPAHASLFAANAKGQAPKALWIGCSDSRKPESVLTGTKPGDLFVHRNIANCFHPHDASATAVLAYAVNVLNITNIVVVGHYQCGGVLAAMDMAKARAKAKGPQAPTELIPDEGQATIERWLNPIRALAVAQLSASGDAPVDEKAAHQALVRAHVCAQVSNIESSSVVQKAIREGKQIVVDGWVYDVANGKLVDLHV